MRPLDLEEIYEVLDSDWLYDLLPGDGADDFILQQLRIEFAARAKKEKPSDKAFA